MRPTALRTLALVALAVGPAAAHREARAPPLTTALSMLLITIPARRGKAA